MGSGPTSCLGPSSRGRGGGWCPKSKSASPPPGEGRRGGGKPLLKRDEEAVTESSPLFLHTTPCLCRAGTINSPLSTPFSPSLLARAQLSGGLGGGDTWAHPPQPTGHLTRRTSYPLRSYRHHQDASLPCSALVGALESFQARQHSAVKRCQAGCVSTIAGVLLGGGQGGAGEGGSQQDQALPRCVEEGLAR